MSINGITREDKDNLQRMIRMRDSLDVLEKVIEQDGIILSTPSGIKKRAKRFKKIKSRRDNDLFKLNQGYKDTESVVLELDMKAVACSVADFGEPEEQWVQVNLAPHLRSDFVVSLQECFVGNNQAEERFSTNEVFDYSQTAKSTPVSMEEMSAMVLASEAEPWMVKNQNKAGAGKSANVLLRQIKRFFLSPRKLKKPVADKNAINLEHEYSEECRQVSYKLNTGNFILAFFALAFVAVVPAFALTTYKSMAGQGYELEQKGTEAAMALAAIAGNEDTGFSMEQLGEASAKFKETSLMLDNSKFLALGAAAVTPEKYKSAKALLEVGEKSSKAVNILALGFAKVFDETDRPLIERIESLGNHAEAALPILQDAQKASIKISINEVPAEYVDSVEKLPEQITLAKQSVREISLLADALVGFLGKDEMRTYLLVFQNDSELRPSGGFMGSVAEVRVLNGEIQSIYVPKGGPYDLKSQLTQRVQSPEPLHLINPLWQFQDANWHPDFKQSADRINWFWSKSGQPTLDGVIAVNASFMERVLAVTGPIEMPEYNKTITAENFYLETQKAVEIEYDKEENSPKKFIGDLFDRLMLEVKNMPREKWLSLMAEASKAMETKDIQMAMFRPEEQSFLEQFGWAGEFKETKGDFLAITESNIAGQKTDRVVKESVLHEVEIDKYGEITSRVHLNRVHEGRKNELFYGVRNVSYVRFYLPKGSEVLEASGFLAPPQELFKKPLDTDVKDELIENFEESQKKGPNGTEIGIEGNYTVVGGWLQLDPGRSQDVIIEYKLPFTAKDVLMMMNEDNPEKAMNQNNRAAYIVLYTSQSGKSRDLTQVINMDPAWELEWSKNMSVGQLNNKFSQSFIWNKDQVSALLFNQK